MHGQNLEDLGHLYLTWCHNQPLALFDKDTFVQSLPKRNRELILVLQALAFRFPPGSITPQYYGHLSSMVETARQIVMNRILDRRVDLPTLQTLCLLSVIDFAGSLPRWSLCPLHELTNKTRWQNDSGRLKFEYSEPSCTKRSSE
jgi:hypothetical protein